MNRPGDGFLGVAESAGRGKGGNPRGIAGAELGILICGCHYLIRLQIRTGFIK